jgi:hypothetical protein
MADQIKITYNIYALTQDGVEFDFSMVSNADQVRGLYNKLADSLLHFSVERNTKVRWQNLPSVMLTDEEIAELVMPLAHDGYNYI